MSSGSGKTTLLNLIAGLPTPTDGRILLDGVDHWSLFGAANANDLELGARARELLSLVGLGDKLTAYPRELSAGQQQRVVLARSMVNEPRLLLADEPSSNPTPPASPS